MKLINKTSRAPVAGLLILFATLVLPVTQASGGTNTENHPTPFITTEAEINSLLEYYSIEDDLPVLNITIQIFDKNDELIYSDIVCRKAYDCDERLNLLLNQSDFITEIDNTKIYILTQ